MNVVLLSIHVLAAIVFIGPVTVAASMFPPRARAALDAGGPDPVLETLHRITRVYAVAGIAVPVFGLATGAAMGVLGETWLIVSMLLTAVAAVLLAGAVLPGQTAVLIALSGDVETRSRAVRLPRQLSMVTGLFALTWSVVVVLMIARPGSTTGA
jgi:uncharacterized membrane protein